MNHNEILELSEVLNEGFFADRVVELLKRRNTIDQKSKELFNDIINFVQKARDGQRQVNSGKLSKDALDSIGAYHRAITIIAFQSIKSGSKKEANKAFIDILKTIESEVEEGITRTLVDPTEFSATLTFFEDVRKQTLSEASKQHLQQVEVVKWPNPLY